MPSRRNLLRTASGATCGLLAGCPSLDRGDEGYVQLKSIQVRYSEDGRRVDESILRVTLSSPPGAEQPELNELDGEWADRFETPHEPVVPDVLHADLSRAYETVRYVVGVCCPAWADDEEESVGCYNVATTRENFNRVQVHDRVRASSNGTYLTIHSREGTWSFESA